MVEWEPLRSGVETDEYRSMKKLLFLMMALLLTGQSAFAWGFWGHRRINRLAVFTLPPEMVGLFKMNIDYLTVHSTDPDSRRYAVDGEAARHYMDVDHYGEYPFDNVPRKWDDAVAKFSEDTLQAYGIVPWSIQTFYYRLVNAFKDKNLSRIMKTAADLGHYVADSNVPLHTTENYNGQLTGQKGIHGLWESRIPEVFGDNWDYFVGHADYLKSPLMEAWETVLESHLCLDSVLNFERELTNSMPSDQKFSFEVRGNAQTKVYSYEFVKAYYIALSGQVERRIRTSVHRVGSFWYSAWVDAGQPDLSDLMKKKYEEEVEETPTEPKIKIIDRESGDMGAVNTLDDFLYGCCGHGHGKKCQPQEPLEIKIIYHPEPERPSWWRIAASYWVGPMILG